MKSIYCLRRAFRMENKSMVMEEQQKGFPVKKQERSFVVFLCEDNK